MRPPALRFRRPLRLTAVAASVLLLAGLILAQATRSQLLPFPDVLPPFGSEIEQTRYLDRTGQPLSVSYESPWNLHDRLSLHEIPHALRTSFIVAEDKRFFEHGGADWLARSHAVVQNLLALRAVRGASTITEQVVRMLHPRPRTVWSRWLEGFEAAALERRFAKAEILEFYLNQVPYADRRRGVLQAARYYFDRDLDTLTLKETFALAVLVRSPARLDLHRGTDEIQAPIERLAENWAAEGHLTEDALLDVTVSPLHVTRTEFDVDAAHFLATLRKKTSSGATLVRTTTLDASLQGRVQRILDERLDNLRERDVGDGAVLVVNHETDEVLAWVNGGGFGQEEGGQIDMVTSPRQPGSTLKPLLYALALQKGWTAATLVEDAQLTEAVGHGLHSFRNYSRQYYGPLRIREALGNSLNIPAILAIRHTGRVDFYDKLVELGVSSLNEHPDFYGDGLALGNGELSLFELVTAYAALARGGVYRPLRFFPDSLSEEAHAVFSPEVSSIISDVLSDPEARALEFGRSSVLSMPVQTAVKTGTSNDYRDAWVVGFSHRYTVGVWMGNLDRKPMREITGSTGPALVVRAIFAELGRHEESRPLYLSRKLRKVVICRESGARAQSSCPTTTEWFRAQNVPAHACTRHASDSSDPKNDSAGVTVAHARVPTAFTIERPSPGLHLALDPRIPDDMERFELKLERLASGAAVEWQIDGERIGTSTTDDGAFLWQPTRGRHIAQAVVRTADGGARSTEPVPFLVK